MELDHVAVVVSDIAASAAWYRENLGAEVLYADETWGFLRLGQGKLALVMAHQHPPHTAVRVDAERLASLAAAHGSAIDAHRDGTRGFYFRDPDGNVIEIIHYPPGETAYERKD